jgi:hypothetical protein
MNKIVIPGKVFFFNGVYLTEEAIKLIDSLQTGGTLSFEETEWHKRVFDNFSLYEELSNIDNIINKFISLMKENVISNDEGKKSLFFLHEIREFLKAFEAPKEFARDA